MANQSVIQLINQLKNAQPLNESLKLQFGDCSLKIISNSAELIKKLTFYYDDFLGQNDNALITVYAIEGNVPEFGFEFIIKKPDPGKKRIKEEYIDFPDGRVVRKRLTGMHFLFGGEDHLAIGPCIENDNQVINFINNRFIQWTLRKGALLGHAAGIFWNGRGLSMAGFAGMGKSSLALRLMSRGVSFVSNDRVMVMKNDDNSLQMYGVPKLPRVNPGTVLNNEDLKPVIPEDKQEEFRKLPTDELWDLEYKYDVFIDQCFGKGKFLLQTPLNALVILNWRRDNSPTVMTEVNLNERRDLLQAFMKSTGLFFEPEPENPEPDFSEEAYIDFLQHCKVFEISGGVDFDNAADKCMEYLEKGHI